MTELSDPIVNEVPQPADQPVNKIPSQDEVRAKTAHKEKAETASEPESRGKVTFLGNSYDVTSVIAVVTGAVVFLACCSCGQFFYCLPAIPIILGIIGVVMAKDSVDPRRTRLLSWLGVGGGGISVVLFIGAIVAYFAFIFFIILISNGSGLHYYNRF